ncbi:MAG: hypothetical protein ACD_28C00078G0001 [uncultured bacterium]|nr:MAG: hypothetical protein ACD_28C00078G0001 [uncultured bacterium]KKT76682.1 MAG: hypothetical protein UW70_C0015G0005 [Candidatus Peregrinibacteria bacterium GW2011_GWA2_44_7]
MTGCSNKSTTEPEEVNNTNEIETTEEVNPTTQDVYAVKIMDDDTNEQIPEGVILTGCEDSYLVKIPVQVDSTLIPLEGALKGLFVLEDREIGQSGLINALYQSDMEFDYIENEGDTTVIGLVGAVQFGGTCDVPRVMDQVEKTIELYEDNYKIIWNGSETGWACLSDQSGECK